MHKQIMSMGTMFLLVLSMFAISVNADTHSMSPSVTVGNSAPTIYYMALDNSTFDPTESSTTRVTLTYRVMDDNGVSDINDSLSKVEVDDAATFSSAVAKYTNTSCTSTDLNTTHREYQCQWDMDYWDVAGTYSTKVYAGDAAGEVSNDTTTNAPTYTYTTLVATDIDSLSISFGSVTAGTLNNAATENPTTLNNTGNAALYINVTGADLTGGAYTYVVGNFSIDLDSNPTGEQALTTASTQVAGASIAKGTDGTPSPEEEFYWFADVPTGLQTETYTGTWTLTQYEQ